MLAVQWAEIAVTFLAVIVGAIAAFVATVRVETALERRRAASEAQVVAGRVLIHLTVYTNGPSVASAELVQAIHEFVSALTVLAPDAPQLATMVKAAATPITESHVLDEPFALEDASKAVTAVDACSRLVIPVLKRSVWRSVIGLD